MIYVEGESKFISITQDDSFSLQSPPLCCCIPFTRSSVTKEKFKFIKFLIIQMPIAHISIFIVLNIIYIEDIQVFDKVIIFFIPLIAVSVLSGVYGFNLLVRTLSPFYSNLKLVQKYFAFQLVLFFCKILPLLLNAIMKVLIKNCDGAFTILVKRRIIIQIMIQIEILCLSLWAKKLYRDPMMKM
jgi:organic solute transporter subunit alpha